VGPSNTANPRGTARLVAGIFFPQRPLLRLSNHGYSQAMLRKILEAGGHVKSFALAAKMLDSLAELPISERHVGRLVQEIGQEMAAARDRQTEDYVHHRRQAPQEPVAAAVAIAVDGGRVLTRTPHAGQGPGVHEHGWKEDKVACLQVLDGPTFAADPHPLPPRVFVDKAHVTEMVREFQAQHGLRTEATAASVPLPSPAPAATPVPADTVPPPAQAALPEWPPQRLRRTCLATLQDSEAFGKLLAAEAYARNFFAAGRRAFLGDGQKYNWTIHEKWFKDFEPIADFIHPLSYLYLAATAIAVAEAERWSLYLSWMTACWQGRVSAVLAELRQRQALLGPGPPGTELPDSDPRLVLERVVTYLENNGERMDYPRYRQAGLPVTSAAVESLIKEVNYRVKGTEKFWNQPAGVEAVLQVRAALLSSDDRLGQHLRNRPGSAHRFGRRRQAGKDKKAA